MPKRFVCVQTAEQISTRILDMRQDVGFKSVITKTSTLNFSASGNFIALSPDQTGAVLGVQNSSNNFRYINDPATLEFAVTPVATFGNTIYAVAISNTHYAVGGSSPFLYVFRRSDHGLETVATTGLGTVTALDFSPDGTKLAVAHQSGAGLRVYNTSTWAYTDAATAFSTAPTSVCFSADGTRIVAGASSGTNYVSVYSADLATRHFNNTTSSYGQASAGSSGGPRSVRSPINANHVLLSTSTAANPVIQVDVTTGTISTYSSIPGTTSAYAALVADPEAAEDAVYVHHATSGAGRTWTKLRCSTRTMYPTQPDEFRMLMYGNGSLPYSTGYIIRSTPYLITGTVRDASNAPAARVVRAYDRTTGELMAQTTSDAGTGNYTLKVYSAGPYDLQFIAYEDRNVVLLLKGDGADGSTNIVDSSLYGLVPIQTGTSNVTVSTASPKYDSGSLRFNGSAAIRYLASPNFELSGPNWTIDLQAKLDGAITTGNRHLIQIGQDVNNRLNIVFTGGTRKVELYTSFGGSGATRISGGTVASDTWHQIRLTKNGTTYSLYQDNTLLGTYTGTLVPNGPCMLEIGTQSFSPASTDWHVGYIEQVRFTVGSVLSGAQSAAWPNPTVELLNDIFYAKVTPAATT